MRQVSRRGGVSVGELRAMDITQFFITLVNYEEEIDAEIKANKEAINKYQRS